MIVLIVILVILAGAAVGLYFLGKRLEKKQAESQERIQASKQPVTMLVIDKKMLKLKESGLPEDAIEAESSTVGGWTLESFGGFPKAGDSFQYRNLTVTVLSMDGRRVEKVLIKINKAEE